MRKRVEGRNPGLVEREPALREEGVEAQPRDVHDVERKAGHEGVPLDVIEVVHGIDAREELAQQLEPAGPPALMGSRHPDQEGHLGGIEGFARGKGSRRAPSDPRNQAPQLPDDDRLTQILMGEPILAEEMVVEEMAVRSVPHVMEQARHPEQFLHAVRGRDIRADLLQRWVEVAAELAGHVHRPQGVLKPRMFGCRVDPAGALELVNPPETLHPEWNRSGPSRSSRRRPTRER